MENREGVVWREDNRLSVSVGGRSSGDVTKKSPKQTNRKRFTESEHTAVAITPNEKHNRN